MSHTLSNEDENIINTQENNTENNSQEHKTQEQEIQEISTQEVAKKVYPISEILQEVSQISTILIVGKLDPDPNERIHAEPFYGYFFTNLSKRVTTQIPTLAVALIQNQMTLCINPNFWKEDLDNFRYKLGGIKHEILHLVFDHVMTSMRWSNKRLFNVAADLVVNQFIPRNQLLDGVVLLEKFPELNLLPFESSQYYYNRLMELHNECSMCKNGEKDDNVSWQNLQKFLGDDSDSQEKHIYWEDIQKLSEAERQALRNQQKKNMRKIIKGSKLPGNFPNDFREDLENFDVTQKPQLHWRDILKVFASNSSRTYIKNTLKRPSKRYGTSPGIKIAKKQKILVAIDTSGSIDQDQLTKFFEQVYHIWRQGVEVHVAECDTEIGRTYSYKGKLLPNMTGGGGTDFNDPIKFANEKYKPDAMIYFTDGYGDVPYEKPKCKMIWILSNSYAASADEMASFPGKKMYMPG
jgi:predicted metal-dependent peptidase